MKNHWLDLVGRHQKLFFLTALCFLGFMAYENTLHVPFVFDDISSLVENPNIRLTKPSLDGFLNASISSPHPRRWLAYGSFALNYLIHQDKLPGYHLFNIAIHIGTAILLFFLFKATLQRTILADKFKSPDLIAFFAALLWLVHPIQTQAVTYTVQRMTSMSAMFYVLALLFYIYGRLSLDTKHRLTFWFFSLVAGLLALGSKEIAATLPLFILLYELFFFQDLDSRSIKRSLPLILSALLVFGLIVLFFLGTHPLKNILAGYAQRDFTLSQRMLTQSRVIIFYISLLLYPAPSRLNLDHDIAISTSLFNPMTTAASLIAIITLIFVALFSATKYRLPAFAILWFLGNLAIESSAIGLEMIFEHRLYLPSIFLSLLAVSSICKLRRNWLRIGIITCLCLTFTLWTHSRNSVWQSDLSLWSDVISKSPLKARGYNDVGMHYFKNRQPEQAIPFFQKSILLDNTQDRALGNLGLCYLGTRKVDQSISEFSKAIALKPNEGMYHVNLGIAYWQKGFRDLARKEMAIGRELNAQRRQRLYKTKQR